VELPRVHVAAVGEVDLEDFPNTDGPMLGLLVEVGKIHGGFGYWG
jgi:hypothetical protein